MTELSELLRGVENRLHIYELYSYDASIDISRLLEAVRLREVLGGK